MMTSRFFRLVARGCAEQPRGYVHGVGGRRDEWLVGDRDAFDADVVFILPTLYSRLGCAGYCQTVAELMSQLDEIQGALGMSVGLVTVIQCRGENEVPMALARTDGSSSTDEGPVWLMQMVTMTLGKVSALNRVFDELGDRPRFIGWVDDDVLLQQGCLKALISTLSGMRQPAAVGASKVPHTSCHRSSRMLARAKRLMPSAMNYPHGCAMAVSRAVVVDGIPTRYASDDAWVCFRLLDAEASHPLHRLVLEPEARVQYVVGGSFVASLRRLRRQRLGQVLLMADADAPVRRCYVRHCFLQGVEPLPRGRGRSLVASTEVALYSWVHLLSTGLLMAELVIRGGLGLPLHAVRWGSPISPEGSGTPTRGESA